MSFPGQRSYLQYLHYLQQSDCHCHFIGSPQAGVMRKSIVQALGHSFKDRYSLGISGVSSALEYSSFCFLYTPQEVGRIRTFLQKTTSTTTAHGEAPSSSWRTRWGASFATQFAFASTVHDRYILRINESRKVWICSYALHYAALEVCVFATSACFVSKRSFEFRHETTGKAEDRGQEEKKMKLHVWGFV
jgi:hypothetical protein